MCKIRDVKVLVLATICYEYVFDREKYRCVHHANQWEHLQHGCDNSGQVDH